MKWSKVPFALGVLTAATFFSAATEPRITVELTVAPGTNPTIITEGDSSGTYKLVQVGQSSFKLVNLDNDVRFLLGLEPGVTDPVMRVSEVDGTWGPLGVTWYVGGVVSSQESLDPGESSSCTGCDRVDFDWE